MKKLILLLVIFISSYNHIIAQHTSKMQAIENGLIPYVPVQGFTKWTIKERMLYHNVPGVSMAVIKNFTIDYAKSYGVSDTLRKTPVTNETIFSAGSISKLVTAVIVLRLVDEGKLHLDTPVNRYLKSWTIKENEYTKQTPITLRMLLSHTAGTSQTSYWGFEATTKVLPTVVEILRGDKIAQSNPVVVNSTPNKEFRYSGGGYMIVQLVLMDVLQRDFDIIAQQYVFKPLQMQHSTFAQPLPANLQQKFSNGYSAASWYKGTPYIYPQQAAAGLHSTATDLAKLIIAIQKSLVGKATFLTKKMASTLISPVTTISSGQYKEQMGVGAFLLEKNNNKNSKGKYFEHQGANAGFIAFAIGSVVDGNGAVILLNTGDDFNAFGTELRRSIAQNYNWYNFLPEKIKPMDLPKTTLQEYVGRYRKGADEVVYLKQEKNYLVENINQSKNIYCFTTSKDTIVFTDYNIKGFFVRNDKGEVIGLRNAYMKAEDSWAKMKVDEFTPSEYLKMKKYEEAKKGFATMNMNEGQITYLAYELINKKPLDTNAVKTILNLATEKYPTSSMVYSRWGDYYLKLDDKLNAIKSYEKALEFDPNDQQVKDILTTLK